MMDPRWGSKRRQTELETVDNLEHEATNNSHRGLKTNITSLYGGETWKEICILEMLRIKIERRAADLQFLKQCRNKRIIPHFAKVNHRLFNQYNNKSFLKLSLALIRSEIKRTQAALDNLNRLALSWHLKLTMKISPDLWKIVDAKAALKAQTEGRIARERQSKKIAKLEKDMVDSNSNIYSSWVVPDSCAAPNDSSSSALIMDETYSSRNTINTMIPALSSSIRNEGSVVSNAESARSTRSIVYTGINAGPERGSEGSNAGTEGIGS